MHAQNGRRAGTREIGAIEILCGLYASAVNLLYEAASEYHAAGVPWSGAHCQCDISTGKVI